VTPDQAKASYRRLISVAGETIAIRRMNAPPAEPIEVLVRAHVSGYQPHEMIPGRQIGNRRVIVLAEDVEASGFPVPLRTGGSDKAVVRGKMLNINVVDDSTRRIAGVLIAYEIVAVG
jgi:hypothetical protein